MAYASNPFDHMLPHDGPYPTVAMPQPFNRVPVFSTMGRGPRGEQGERGFPGEASRKDFETVADMVAEGSLEAGDICHTLGFHAAGDGGAAWYQVTDDATANGMDIIALENGLYAELQITEAYVTPEMFGALGDGEHDDTVSIKAAMQANSVIVFNTKTYLISEDITLIGNYFDLNGATIDSNNYIVKLSQESKITNGTLLHTSVETIDGKNYVCNIKIKDWANDAVKIGGYENIINKIRLENDTNSTTTVGIHIVLSDNTINDVYGYGAFIGIIIETSTNCYVENVHLWLSGNNTFTGSTFIKVNSTLNSFIDCCCDSYETFCYIDNTYLNITFRDCYWITNSTIFPNKAYVLFSGSNDHNDRIAGNLTCKLTGVSSHGSTVNYGNTANVKINLIDGSLTTDICLAYDSTVLENDHTYIFNDDSFLSAQSWNADSTAIVQMLGPSGSVFTTITVKSGETKDACVYCPKYTRLKVLLSGSNCSVSRWKIIGYKEI